MDQKCTSTYWRDCKKWQWSSKESGLPVTIVCQPCHQEAGNPVIRTTDSKLPGHVQDKGLESQKGVLRQWSLAEEPVEGVMEKVCLVDHLIQ